MYIANQKTLESIKDLVSHLTKKDSITNVMDKINNNEVSVNTDFSTHTAFKKGTTRGTISATGRGTACFTSSYGACVNVDGAGYLQNYSSGNAFTIEFSKSISAYPSSSDEAMTYSILIY